MTGNADASVMTDELDCFVANASHNDGELDCVIAHWSCGERTDYIIKRLCLKRRFCYNVNVVNYSSSSSSLTQTSSLLMSAKLPDLYLICVVI